MENTSVKAQKSIDVVLAADHKFLPYTAVTINSILRHWRSSSMLRIFILVDKEPNEAYKFRFNVLLQSKDKASIIFLVASAGRYAGIRTTPGISEATFYRLNMHYMLPEDCKRVVYTDSDVIFKSCISELFKADLKGNLFAGVEDSVSTYYNEKFDVPPDAPHVNAGVLLVDIKLMRSIPFTDLCMNFIEEHGQRIELGDQQIINEVFSDQITYLPVRWNVHGSMFEKNWPSNTVGVRNKMSLNEALDAIQDPSGIHYTYKRKPWTSLNHPRAREWYEYVKGCGFEDKIARIDILIAGTNKNKLIARNTEYITKTWSKIKKAITKTDIWKISRDIYRRSWPSKVKVDYRLAYNSGMLSNQFHELLYQRVGEAEFSASIALDNLRQGGNVLTNMRKIDLQEYNSNLTWLFSSNSVGQRYINNSSFVALTVYRPDTEQFWKCIEQSSFYGLPTYFIESSFFASFGGYFDDTLDGKYRRPIGFVIDDIRYYFDARGPSRLEIELNKSGPIINDKQIARSKSLIRKIIDSRITKYNAYVSNERKDMSAFEGVVLVVDQKRSDMSIELARSDNGVVTNMLDQALSENPNKVILFKWHPDNIHMNAEIHIKNREMIIEVRDEFSTVDILDVCSKVYTISSQVGFEALLRDKEVVVYGQPFYSGWGLTDDRNKNHRRTEKRTIEELFYLTCVKNSIYFEGKTGNTISMEQSIENILKMRAELDATQKESLAS
ncbi:General stress protein A [Pseudovibrio axinellae]|uniref:General stress protein A n=1 Tax=Pseudovibrio axinellae TaxID=989403 RepID=A0A165XIQ3_9HYPH|nr:glycosyltransferase [Pseudovibrio axinellae]KZL17741.1 General stress protein A [Pseudovibrio axinellae]SER41651.1 capsular polysaccharide export protein [Pseudovibrio axinellae]